MADPGKEAAYGARGEVLTVWPAPMDSDVVKELREMTSRSPGGLNSLIACFVAREEAFLADPKVQPDALDFDFLRANAHRLKGSAGSLGARALAEFAGHLEYAAGRGDHAQVSALITRVRTEFARAIVLFGEVYGVRL